MREKMQSNNKTYRIQILIIMAILFFQGASAWATGPQAAMEVTVEKVMGILTEPDLAGDDRWAERRELVADVLSKRFDFNEMAKRALAKAWNKRTNDEKEKFVTLFKDLLKNTYVERLQTYTDGSYKVVFDKVLVRGKRAVVHSIVTQRGRDISAAYKMYQQGDEWFVYDVVIEGVSLVSNYRSQFVSVIQKDGYEELVHRLEKKIAEPRSSQTSSEGLG